MTDSEKLNAVYNAIVGDNLGNKGIVARMAEVEDYQEKDKKFKNRVAGGLFVANFGFATFWSYILKHF